MTPDGIIRARSRGVNPQGKQAELNGKVTTNLKAGRQILRADREHRQSSAIIKLPSVRGQTEGTEHRLHCALYRVGGTLTHEYITVFVNTFIEKYLARFD
ncbi:hypothetical protein CCGE525_25190 (plasmid) [Rhizobium jaguaris]|uniref:Uncharacterized protein n=1 Tax=Rhizobium jaguaris TaxID=1312183 RepID=A0A387FTZ3_9HYPH|nr:hypothetical protein CCGE525_25190 [Rhizobium jaguaris]